MSIKISELPQATSVGSSDIVPIVQGGTTKQATAEMINTDNYSTTEQKVGTWIDGKPLYRKVIPIPAQTLTASLDVAHGISNIGYVINTYGYMKYNTSSYMIGGYYQNTVGDEFYATVVSVSTTAVRLAFCQWYFSTLSQGGYIALEYTKTTDTATRSLNLTRSENTGSLVGLGDKAEVTDETLEKTKLDEVTEVKEVEPIKEIEESGDKGE